MFQLDLNRARSAVKEVKQTIERIQPVLELKAVSQQAPYTIPEGTTFKQLRAELLQLMAEENVNHYRMGPLYSYIVDNELAKEVGFKDAPTSFRQHLADLSTATLSTYSFGTRSARGSCFIERILTATTTRRQQKLNVLEWLTQALGAFRRGPPSPPLLPMPADAQATS